MGLFRDDNNNNNGDDCERPACDDVKSALPKSMAQFEAMKKKYEQQKQQQQQQQAKQQTPVVATNSNSNSNTVVVVDEKECPPGSAELGRGTWNLLHSMAAWFPDVPTPEQRDGMVGFVETLGEFYPCTYCAKDFRENLEKSPVASGSRTDLCLWLCEQHNVVNEKLGKPLFECTMNNLDERWRKSSAPKCNK